MNDIVRKEEATPPDSGPQHIVTCEEVVQSEEEKGTLSKVEVNSIKTSH